MWRASEIRRPCLALIIIIAAMALRPGDSPWFFDMSRNFNLAIQFNATPSHPLGLSLPFTPSPYALKGTHGIRYGPVPVWIDQVFLAFTHNLLTMTVIRTVVFSLLTSLGLLWLTQLIRVTPWLAVVAMLSPWMWYYSRELWDNSLTIPFTALLLPAYGQFLKSRRAWPLCLAVVCAALTCLVHLIVVPFLAVLALHLLFFESRLLLKFKWPILATVLAMLALSAPYLHYALTFHGSGVPQYASRFGGWIFPLLDAQHLTAKSIGYFLEENFQNIHPAPLRYLFTLARLFTYIAFIACWIGMIMAIPLARRAFGLRDKADVLDHLCLIGLVTFLFQTLFDGLEHVSFHPHYYNTTWIVYVMFAWIGFNAIPRWFGSQSLIARLLIPIYAACLLFVQIIIAWQISRNSGGKGDHYNAILSNQIEVATEMNRFSTASPIDIQVQYWTERPDTLPVLRKLMPTPPGLLPTRQLVVRFRDAFPGDAKVIVENQPLGDIPTTQP